jgi:hypothetical protein
LATFSSSPILRTPTSLRLKVKAEYAS